MLVLELLPVVAEPPVVLPVTDAVPDVAVCVFVLVEVSVFVLVRFSVFVTVESMVLSELGPVVLIVPELVLLPAAQPANPAVPIALLTVPDAVKLFVLFVAPLVALPPVVLPLTSAGPETAA